MIEINDLETIPALEESLPETPQPPAGGEQSPQPLLEPLLIPEEDEYFSYEI